MIRLDSSDGNVADRRQLAVARRLLVAPVAQNNIWAVVLAAAFAAASALALATATILVPPVGSTQHSVGSPRIP